MNLRALTFFLRKEGKKNWKTVLFLFLIIGTFPAQTIAQIALDLTNDTRANDRYCDDDGTFFTGCGVTYTDDGGTGLYSGDLVDTAPPLGAENDYGDNDYEPILWTFCPDDPSEEKIKLSFTEFGIHTTDQFYVYDGPCHLANGDIDPNIGVPGLDDDSALDLNNLIQIAGATPSQMLKVAGTGTVLFGAGWIEASCENASGCITIGWNPNGDKEKGIGWKFETACIPRNAGIACTDMVENTPVSIAAYDGLSIGCSMNITLAVPPPIFRGCANGFLTYPNTNQGSPYMVEVLIDGTSLGFVGGNLAAFPNMTVGVGRHVLTYVLYYDLDNDGDPYDGQLIEKQRLTCEFTIFDAVDLVCNAEINVSLGDDCATRIAPEDLLDEECAPAYPLRMDLNGRNYFSPCNNCIFTDIDGNTLNLDEGTYNYILRDNCNNACFGRINLRDIQAPQCQKNDLTYVLCTNSIPEAGPNFLDCNPIVETSFQEQVYGDCGKYTANDVYELENQLQFFDTGSFLLVGPNTYILPSSTPATGSGAGVGGVIPFSGFTAERIIIRNWKATDNKGNTTTNCPQSFLSLRPDSLLMPRLPIIEVECGTGISPTELINAINSDSSKKFEVSDLVPYYKAPLLTPTADSIVGVFPNQINTCHYTTVFNDQILEEKGNTKKILRTWTWLDWCASPSSIRTEPFIQIIKVIDNEEPIKIKGPLPMTRSADPFECNGVNIVLDSVEWVDNCGSIVSYRTEIRNVLPKGGIGSVLYVNQENGGRFPNVPIGCYHAVYYATDEFSNETSSFGGDNGPSGEITQSNIHVTDLCVVDDIKAQARCFDQINISLSTDQDRVYAFDVDAGSYDNCGIADIAVSLTDIDSTYASFITLTCEDIGKELQIFLKVTDINGNTNVCWGVISIIKHAQNEACGNLQSNMIGISGKLTNPVGELLETVNMLVESPVQTTIMAPIVSGDYAISLPAGEVYTLTPEKNTNPVNGVSTFDLLLISKHILGTQKFDTPYKYIASDLNKSGTITSFDLILLRKIILGLGSEFEFNAYWRFIDASYDFGDDLTSTLEQDFPESATLNGMNPNQFSLNFIGVKIGDINGNAVPNRLVEAEPRHFVDKVNLELKNTYISENEPIAIPVNIENISIIEGFQFALNFPHLELLKVESGLLNEQYWNATESGNLLVSWTGKTLQKEPLFTLYFKAKKEGYLSQLLTLKNDRIDGEAYTSELQIKAIALDFKVDKIRAFSLLQNHPNPVNGLTTIEYTLPESTPIVLNFMNTHGQLLKTIQVVGEVGKNQIQINTNTLAATGVIYYQLSSNLGTATRKMIVKQH